MKKKYDAPDTLIVMLYSLDALTLSVLDGNQDGDGDQYEFPPQ